MRPVTATSAAVYGEGGTKKSSLLTAVPTGVVTEMCPERAPVGTLVVSVVVAAELTAANAGLNRILLLAGDTSKFVPVMVTAVPAVPMVGVNPVMVGAPTTPPAVTANGVLLVADPVGVVTVIGPVVAPAGTVTTRWVAVAEVTVAATQMKVPVILVAVR